MKQEILEKVLKARKNLIIAGNVASGKTTNVLFPIVDNAIDNKESLFILDAKEEYLNQYYSKLKENDYNTIIINLRDLNKSEDWNPLEYPYNLYKNGDNDKSLECLEKIGKTIFYDNSQMDPYWYLAASDFFTGVTLGLFEDANKEEVNFNSVANMFNGVDNRFKLSDYITEYFRAKDSTSNAYVLASSTFLAPRETKGGIISAARQKLMLLVTREKLSHLLNKTTFNFEDIGSKPTAIIFITRDENMILNFLASMFIEQLYMLLVEKKLDNKFNFILDNFDTVERYNSLVDIVGSCTSRNIKFTIATRNLDEISKTYGDYLIDLCDLVDVNSNNIRVVIDGQEEIIEKDLREVNISNVQIEYPSLKEESIKLFDLEQLVRDNAINNKINIEKNNPFIDENTLSKTSEDNNPYDGKSIEEILEVIDNKIAELEKDMAEDEVKRENSSKSELEQFKIKD